MEVQGTFKSDVYAVVRKIPRGEVRTYQQVAVSAGYPRAYRAVGTVLGKNTDPTVPCHRVIRSDGSIGEYRDGSAAKRERLAAEGAL